MSQRIDFRFQPRHRTWRRTMPARAQYRARILATVLGILLIHSLAQAEPPSVTVLNPSGLQRGTTADLKILGKPGTLPVSLWSDCPQVSATISEDGTKVSVTATETASPGIRFLRFFNAEGASGLIPIMIGVLPEVAESEPNDRQEEAQAVDLPCVVNGVLHRAGEVDTFAVQLQAGDTLTASVESHRAFGSPMDGVLQLIGPAGNVLIQNDDHHGIDPQLTFTASDPGQYCVRVFAFPATPDSSIRFAGGDNYVYRLTLTTGPFLPFLSPARRATEAALPGLHHALPQLPDEDWLELTDLPEEVPSPQPRLTWIGALTEQTQEAIVPVRLSKGGTVAIRVEARDIGSTLDPLLRVRDASGKQLLEVDDSGRRSIDIATSFNPPADGEYLLAISDRFHSGSADHHFRLTLELETPRFELTVKEDRYLLNADKPLEIAVDVDRIAKFDQRIGITALDPPEGVIVTPAISEPTGDSSKQVTLKLEAGSATHFNGPLRIAGIVLPQGTNALEGVSFESSTLATVATPAALFRSPAIWLTLQQ